MRVFLLFLVFAFYGSPLHAQPPVIYEGIGQDSALISFCDTMSSLNAGVSFQLDTSHTTLWRSGSSSKAFFGGTPGRKYGIMTDTAAPYPTSQDEWFTLRINTHSLNPIIAFTHRFQTDSGRDGGVVEYSFDSTNWNNVVGGCFSRMLTEGFYSFNDTLSKGVAAFSGTSGWITSRFQIFQGIPLKETGTCWVAWPYWIRFRFISDSQSDTLAGWQIRDIRLDLDQYKGGVGQKSLNTALDVRPNPASDGVFIFPELPQYQTIELVITNALGQIVVRRNYATRVDISALPAGQYFYRAGNYRGRLIRR